MKRLLGLVRNQSGVTLVIGAVSMVAMLGGAALAVDVGMLMAARAASQRAADGAAMAGAGYLIIGPTDEANARIKATEFAAANPVRGMVPNVLPEDIDVDLAAGLVRVRIHHTAARGTGIPTAFAGVLGIGAVDVLTSAAAQVLSSGGITSTSGDCPLPLSMIDNFIDGDPYDQIYTGDPPDYYNRETTGFNDSDYGSLLELKVDGNSGQGGPPYCEHEVLDLCNAFEDSWHCWYLDQETAEAGDCGVDCIGPRIYPAEYCGPGLSVGDTVVEASAAGNKQSMVHTDYNGGGPGSFYDLINNDPDNLHWSSSYNCVVSGNETECYSGENLRLRDVPLLDPTTIQGNGGNNEAVITDFMGVFVEAISCNYDGTPASEFLGPNGNWNVYFRLVNASGAPGEPGWEEGTGTLTKRLQLVE